MLEKILKKLGADSAEEFWEKEDELFEKYEGMEIEYRSPLFYLTNEESLFFRNYCREKGLI